MEIAIDIGNTATKIALFNASSPLASNHLPTHKPPCPTPSAGLAITVRNPVLTATIPSHDTERLEQFLSHLNILTPQDTAIISSTAGDEQATAAVLRAHGVEAMVVQPTMPLPIRNGYRTPATVGPDRLAAACAAHFLAGEMNGGDPAPALVIDAGTAITYDLIDDTGTFLGGNISPGIALRFQALHDHTAHLPLVQPTAEEAAKALSGIGDTTRTAIIKGVVQGVKMEMATFIHQTILKHPAVFVFLTGRVPFPFDDIGKSRTFAVDFLVPKGLDIILRYSRQANAL